MTRLFKRVAEVTVETAPGRGVGITGLRVQFKVTKTLRPEPNTAEVTITNLSAETRRQVQPAGSLVTLVAGYDGATKQLFQGDMRLGNHTRQGTEWVTRLEAGDGEKEVRQSKVVESFQAGARKEAVVKRLLETMKLNVRDAVATVAKKGLAAGAAEFAKGVSISGNTAKELTRILDGMGLSWSIQDGKVEILAKGDLVGDAVFLSPATGLVGTPEIGEKGYVKVRSLLNPLIRPGVGIVLDTEVIKGTFRVEKAEYRGDTHGLDWYVDVEAEVL